MNSTGNVKRGFPASAVAVSPPSEPSCYTASGFPLIYGGAA